MVPLKTLIQQSKVLISARHINARKVKITQQKKMGKRIIQLITSRHFANNPVGLIGVPLANGQPRGGVDLGPGILRDSGLVEQLKRNNRNVTDLGDVEVQVFQEPKGKIRKPKGVGLNNETLSEKVKKALLAYHTVVNLGGDHSMAMGSIAGHSASLFGKSKPAVIWVDAHADINTPESSMSGNLHGQPVSFLMEDFQQNRIQLSGFDWLDPCISPADIAYIGLRDIDPAEIEYLKRYFLYFDHFMNKLIQAEHFVLYIARRTRTGNCIRYATVYFTCRS